MSFLKKIIFRLGKVLPARKEKPNRIKKGSDFKKRVSVALVGEDLGEDVLKARKKYIQHLKGEYGIREIILMIYSPTFEPDRPNYLTHLKELSYFDYESLNWRHKPTELLKGFCKRDTDILIDLTNTECEPLEHLVSASEASMKVGPKGGVHEEYMDLIVDVTADTDESEYLIKVENLLSKLSFN